MESSDDKHWASKYLLDPLNSEEPSSEAFGDQAAVAKLPSPPTSPNRLSKNPYRKASTSSKRPPGSFSPIGRSSSLSTKKAPTPAPAELPHRSNTHSHGHTRNISSKNYPTSPMSPTHPSTTPPRYASGHRQEAFSSPNSPTTGPGRPRGSSLTSRFPGDTSHRPLDTLSREKAVADRSAHITRKHYIPPDTIDSLDSAGGLGAYHHAGPYDATLLARNNFSNPLKSPVEAVAASNAEALKATPRENIIDSLQGHRPLDGVATYPSGTADRTGRVYRYKEGENMMIESGEPGGGAYKRWPGVEYLPGDIKGKGEPSYSIEKTLKEKKENEKALMKAGKGGEVGFEMTTNAPASPPVVNETWMTGAADDENAAVGRSSSKRLSGGGLKTRFGSIKRHLHGD